VRRAGHRIRKARRALDIVELPAVAVLGQDIVARLGRGDLAPTRAQPLDGDVEQRAVGVRAGAAKVGRTHQEPVRFVRERRRREINGLDVAHGEHGGERPLADRRQQEHRPDGDDD